MEEPSQQAHYPPWTSSLPPAPGDLRILQAFVNTADIEAGTDELLNPQALGTWLTRWGLLPEGEPLSEDDLEQALEVREALRALVLANHGEALDAAAAAHLDRLGREASLGFGFTAEGRGRLEPLGEGWPRALARLLEILVTAELQGHWSRLKACRNDGCRWAFYDFSKNRSGKWCTMRRCGNQASARAYRRRKTRLKQ